MKLKVFLGIIFLFFVGYSHAVNLVPKAMRASSVLPASKEESFEPSNLFDNKLETVWAVPFKDVPVTIELDVKAFLIHSISFMNGYRRNQKNYEKYGRAKTINIYANDKKHLVKSVVLDNIQWEYCLGEFSLEGCIEFLKKHDHESYFSFLDEITVEDLNEDELEYAIASCKGGCRPMENFKKISFNPALKNVKTLIIEIESIYPGKDENKIAMTEMRVDGLTRNPLKDGYVPHYDTLVDARDGQKYRTIKLGEKRWMADDLKYDAKDSSCFLFFDQFPCNTHSNYRARSLNDSLCPAGWRLPTEAEFMEFRNEIRNLYVDPNYAFFDMMVLSKSSHILGMYFYHKWESVIEIDEPSPFDDMNDRFSRDNGPEWSQSILWLEPSDSNSVRIYPYMTFDSKGNAERDYEVNVLSRISVFAYVRCIEK